jgi:hypothetical protein
MGVSIRRFPEFDVSLLILQGLVETGELTDFARQIDGDLPRRWITYVDPCADLNQLDLPFFGELKRILGPKLRARFAPDEFRSAIVTDSRVNDPVVRLWSSFASGDGEYPANPVVVSSLGSASDYLELPAAARLALVQAIDAPAPGESVAATQ